MNRFGRHGAYTAALISTVFAAACSSSIGTASINQASSSLSAADRHFISQAAYGSLGEIRVGRLAQEQAASAPVRELGQMMVEDHTALSEELIRVASADNVAPPTAPDPGREAVADMLDQLTGPAFDREYVAQQLSDHLVSLTLFQNQAAAGQDAELKAFAQRGVPVIEHHVERLQALHVQTASGS